jgi:hypothetical protein
LAEVTRTRRARSRTHGGAGNFGSHYGWREADVGTTSRASTQRSMTEKDCSSVSFGDLSGVKSWESYFVIFVDADGWLVRRASLSHPSPKSAMRHYPPSLLIVGCFEPLARFRAPDKPLTPARWGQITSDHSQMLITIIRPEPLSSHASPR